MLPQQLFIIWPYTILNNMFETAGLLQDSLQSQTEYILDNVHQCPDSGKIFFSNLFRAQKKLSENLQTAVNSNFHNLNRLIFDQEIPTMEKPALKDTSRAGTSGSGNTGTSKSETTRAGNKKTSSDSRYGKTKKSKTTSQSFKTGKKET